MMHENRVWHLATVNTKEDLAEKFTRYTWTGCTAWQLGPLYFLNDATCADGAQEYAVCMKKGDGYVQIESITFSWCTYEEAVGHIEACLRYAEGSEPAPVEWPVQINFDHKSPCYLCA